MVTGDRQPPGGKSPAISRAAQILTALSISEPLTLAILSSQVRMPKSSVSDLCATLADTGLVIRSPDQTYRLGHRILALARTFTPLPEVVDIFTAVARRHTALDGHTLALSTLCGNEVLTLTVRMGRHPLALTPRPGARIPLLESAAGLAIVKGATIEALRGELAAYHGHQDISVPLRRTVERLAVSPTTADSEAGSVGAHQIAEYLKTKEVESLTAVTLYLPTARDSYFDESSLAHDLEAFTRSMLGHT